MRRREFITLLGGAAAAGPLAARAQQAGKVYRIGILETIPASQNTANLDALRKGLRALGYIEGQNLSIDYSSADGTAERFPELAGELLRTECRPDRHKGDTGGAGCQERHDHDTGRDGGDWRAPGNWHRCWACAAER